jgi:hypothetical protein
MGSAIYLKCKVFHGKRQRINQPNIHSGFGICSLGSDSGQGYRGSPRFYVIPSAGVFLPRLLDAMQAASGAFPGGQAMNAEETYKAAHDAITAALASDEFEEHFINEDHAAATIAIVLAISKAGLTFVRADDRH